MMLPCPKAAKPRPRGVSGPIEPWSLTQFVADSMALNAKAAFICLNRACQSPTESIGDESNVADATGRISTLSS